jgi:hypothetical protein
LGTESGDGQRSVVRARSLPRKPGKVDRIVIHSAGRFGEKARTGAILAIAIVVLWLASGASPGPAEESPLSRCVLHRYGTQYQGACGPLLALLDHVPTVTLASVRGLTSGAWRDDVHPASAWAGNAADEDGPSDPVELEIYAGNWGILRTQYGWAPVTHFTASPATLRFNLYAYYQIAPNELDRQIVQRAAALLSSEQTWNRADNRQCSAAATTWSIYCALEKATIEVTGGFHHRRPALQVVRMIVDERSVGRNYNHRLMDYNNDSRTHLSDVQSLFKETLDRMANVQWLTTRGFVHQVGGGSEPG